MSDEKDHIEAIAIGIETLGFDIGSSFERRAKASVIEQALKLCGFAVLPAALPHLQAAQTWEPIETAPKDGTEILTTNWRNSDHYFVTLTRWVDFDWHGRNRPAYPTHWMPLPSPPLVAEQETKP